MRVGSLAACPPHCIPSLASCLLTLLPPSAGIHQLSALTQLSRLQLINCEMEAADVMQLARLKQLADLTLVVSQIGTGVAEDDLAPGDNLAPVLLSALPALTRLGRLEVHDCG